MKAKTQEGSLVEFTGESKLTLDVLKFEIFISTFGRDYQYPADLLFRVISYFFLHLNKHVQL